MRARVGGPGAAGRALRGTPSRAHPREARHPGAAIDRQATLRQAWPREEPGAASAFEVSMINVSCNSH